MRRLEKWFEEDPRRSPAEYACALARDRFWRDEHLRLVGIHPDWPDVTYLLGLGEEIAHALVLVLSRLPTSERLEFATAFTEERGARRPPRSLPRDARALLAAAAELGLLVVELTENSELQDAYVVDLLHGAAQGDDLTRTPEPAVARLQRAVAKVRYDPGLEDEFDPHAVASIAIAEILDPSSEVVGVKEVLARAAFATVECRPQAQVLAFLLRAEEIVTEAQSP